EASGWLGRGNVARTEAKLAMDLSAQLPREERLRIEKTYRRSRDDNAGAVEIDRKLLELFPDKIEYGVDLVADLRLSGRRLESLEVLESLRKSPLQPGVQMELDLHEGFAHSQGGRP